LKSRSLASSALEKRPPTKSRAVIRNILPGEQATCPYCGERVKFRAKHRANQVICNVYQQGIWTRVEHYHIECYVQAREPHGVADDSQLHRRKQ
jgi:hypothetical protein